LSYEVISLSIGKRGERDVRTVFHYCYPYAYRYRWKQSVRSLLISSLPRPLSSFMPSLLDIHDNVDIDAANADLDALQLNKLAVLVRR
jgi:hypothetical protein